MKFRRINYFNRGFVMFIQRNREMETLSNCKFCEARCRVGMKPLLTTWRLGLEVSILSDLSEKPQESHRRAWMNYKTFKGKRFFCPDSELPKASRDQI